MASGRSRLTRPELPVTFRDDALAEGVGFAAAAVAVPAAAGVACVVRVQLPDRDARVVVLRDLLVNVEALSVCCPPPPPPPHPC